MANPESKRLAVDVIARVDKLEKELRKGARVAQDNFSRIERDGKRMSDRLERDIGGAATRVGGLLANFGKGLAAGVFAGGAAGVLSQITAVAKGVASIGDEAKRAGLSTRAFQELSFVASQSRIGVDSLVDGIKELNLRADEWIITGSGPAAEAFTRLGYSAEELKQKLADPSALFTEIIGKLEKLDKAAQIRIADEIFGGTGGEKFVQLIAQGEAGIRDTIKAANDLGIVLDDELIQKADELDKKFEAVTTTVSTGLKRAIVEAAGALDDFITKFRQLDADYAARSRATELGTLAGELAGGTPVRTTPKGDRLGQRINVPFNQLPAVDMNRHLQLAVARERIAAIESAGSGGYRALGPITDTGDRAYGRYQVMGSNIADWTKQAIGTALTSEQFLNNPEMQDKVFNHIFSGYIDRFGMEGAAQAWFGGPGAVGKTGATDMLGTSVGGYGQKFMGGITDQWEGLRAVTDETAASTASVAAEYDRFGTVATTALSGIANALSDGKIEGKELLQILAQVVQQLLTMPSPQGGANPIGSLLGSLLGGIPGFASGTNYAPGGVALVGERGPELVNLPRGARVIPNRALKAPQVPARQAAQPAAQPVTIAVQIDGANGDDHVRKLVAQGVQQGIGQYDKALNGTFGKRMVSAQRRQM